MDGSLTIEEATWTEGMSLGPLSFSTIQDWTEAGIRLWRALHSIIWLSGDLYNAGSKFGPERRKIIESAEWRAAGGPSYGDCKHYGSLARRFPERWRRLHPSPSFFQAVRRLPDAVAFPMLQKAAEEKWTLRRMRSEAGRIRNSYTPTGPDIADSLKTLIAEGKRFRVVLADVPWHDEVGDGGGHQYGSHTKHYAGKSFAELAGLPVDQVVTDDGYILLWCPAKLLKMGIALLEAWGTEYMTCSCWIKEAIGTGHYFRMRHELLLLGVRSKAKPFVEKPDSVITAPRQKHSEKPPIHDIIAAAVGDGPYIEMFARRRVPGWTVVGDEIDRPAPVPPLPVAPVIDSEANPLQCATPPVPVPSSNASIRHRLRTARQALPQRNLPTRRTTSRDPRVTAMPSARMSRDYWRVASGTHGSRDQTPASSSMRTTMTGRSLFKLIGLCSQTFRASLT
jgi:N6-adenosine-specific RNA methylase IME4